jgi:hypothetical protein
MAHVKRNNKERLTVSLSSEATRYIKHWRLEHKIVSVSAAFEDIIRDSQRRVELDRLNALTVAYYDSLSLDQQGEESAWAATGEAGLAEIWESENQPVETQTPDLALSR